VDPSGNRLLTGETLLTGLSDIRPALEGILDAQRRHELVLSVLPDMLRRGVEHRGLLREGSSLAMRLIGWAEML
jgi:hypothetical protein